MLLRNEYRYALRQPLVWLCVFVPILFSLLLSSGLAGVEDAPTKQLTLNLIVLHMMVLPVLVAVLSPIVYLRDQQAMMHELIAVTPVSDARRGLVRMLALSLLSFTIISGCSLAVMGLYMSQLGAQGALFEATIGFIALLSLPNAVLLSVLGWLVAQRSANSMLTYVVFGAVLIGYVMVASITGNPALAGSNIVNDTFYQAFIWLDPFAYTAVIKHFSASAEQFNFALLINRIMVIVVSVMLIYVLLRFASRPVSSQPRSADASSTCAAPPSTQCYQAVELHGSAFASFMTLLKTSVHAILTNKLTGGLLLIWALIVCNTVASSNGYIEPLSTLAYTSQDALNHFAFDMLALLGTCLVVLWSWQVTSLARSSNIAQLIAATPMKTHQLLLAHLLTIFWLVVCFLIFAALGSSIAQWLTGSEYQVQAYLSTLSLVGLPLSLLAVTCVCIFHLCRSQVTAGLLVCLIVCIKFTPLMTFLGVTHTLWSVAWTPLQAPDTFWGYRASMSSYWPYMQVWGLAAFSLVCTAMMLSYRGAGLSRGPVSRVHSLLIAPWGLTVAAFIGLHLQLVAEKPLTNSHKREAFKAHYERQFADWRERAQPSIEHLDAKVDFYPLQQRAEFKLTYTLVNHHDEAINQVLIGRAGFYKWADVVFDGAKKVSFDQMLNQAVFEFDQPMAPNETRTFVSVLRYQQPILWPIRGHQFVTPELSYIRSVPFIATVGYQANYELTDPQLRAAHQLAAKPEGLPSMLFADEAAGSGRYDWMTVSSTISTQEGYQAVAPGELVSTRLDNGRHIYQFATRSPIRAIASWLTMPFLAQTKQQNGVTLQVFAPKKDKAAELHLTAMADTVQWFNEHISAYRAKQLSLISVPRIGVTGYALPQVILINDDVGFRAQPEENAGFDQRYRRAVHETAHQWFGHDIGNGVSDDSAFLVESLAKYVELVMLDTHYGPTAVDALVAYESKRYQQRRAMDFGQGRALVDANQSYDQYSRATLVFAKLREAGGDEVIIAALNSLWQHHGYPKRPANSMDFVRYLKVSAGIAHHDLIERLFLQPPAQLES
ncbi:hypothetical protein PULV_a0283 [Pseudoalteromonas ulvae UL12]|uniref:M1 family aminopeptidase n=1 Tax=Pseudoalteromonas ulvae TaxID=107327 RepID=UPI00186BACA1|nr:M1 family aminopeptidase [Pseudoalteromonas ulvae]MBE0362733.1 hypothetical protein [Pseudoalteromonas ulvae UL12]